jgi:hypothetical protein
MKSKTHRVIVVSKTNYETLRDLGHVTDSFNSVIGILLKEREEREKRAAAQLQLGKK